MKKPYLSKKLEYFVEKVASLANLPLDEKQSDELKKQLILTIDYVSKLKELPTENIKITSQVTSLKNVFRADKIIKENVLSQEDALSNAKRKYQGYFVVNAIFREQL